MARNNEVPRVMTAMVTPFNEGGIDREATEDLAGYLVDNGSEGLVLAGTTGESPTIHNLELPELIEVVRGAVSVPLWIGVGSSNTALAVQRAESLADDFEGEIDGFLAVAPYYNRPGQYGIEHYYRSIAQVGLPVLMYDIPTRTGRKIETETILRLAEVDNIAGLKDAAGDLDETAKVIKQSPDDFLVYSGDDARTLDLVEEGAVGVISVTSHWAGEAMRAMIRAAQERRSDEAGKIHRILVDSGAYAFQSSEAAPNPIPAKVMMNALGIRVGEGRPPMIADPETMRALYQEARIVLDDFHGRYVTLQKSLEQMSYGAPH